MEIVTVSSKGQVVIPKEIRKAMGIDKRDKFIIVYDKDTILLKKVKEKMIRKRMKELLDKFSDEFEKQGIKIEDVEKEIRAARNKSA